MAVPDGGPGPTRMGSSPDAKTATLVGLDLAMLATAARYNIDDLTERTRSHRHLVQFFMELVRHSGADLFVEAGAKEASASKRVRKLLPSARIVAFEANPFTYAEFVPSAGAIEIEYLNVALTDAPGKVVVNVHRDEHGQPIANGQASLLQRDKEPKDRERGFHQVTVDAVSLDGFFSEFEFSCAALWVDVEGACKFVLSGAREMLLKTAVAMVEVEDATYWGSDHWLRQDVVSYLYDLGLVPIARDFENVNKWSSQCNIVFVRAELLDRLGSFRNELARFRSRAYAPVRRRPPAKAAPAPPPVSERLRQRALHIGRAAQRRLRAVPWSRTGLG